MHYSPSKGLVAFVLLSTTAAAMDYYRDAPARQTPAAESPEYDAGLSPVPTPGLGLRNAAAAAAAAVLGPRSLAPDNCGYRQREDGSEWP